MSENETVLPFRMPEEIIKRNDLHMSKNLAMWLRNIRSNCHLIEQSYQYLDGAVNYSDLPLIGTDKARTVAIVASGASLREYVPFLLSFDGTIIASPTNLPFLLSENITPDITLIADPQDVVADQIASTVYDHMGGLTFVVPTFASPNVLAILRYADARTLFYNAFVAAPDGSIKNSPFNAFLNGLFADFSIGWMLQAGCVTNTAVFLAGTLHPSVETIYLVGAEYSVPHNGLPRIPMFHYDLTEDDWKEVEGPPPPAGLREHPLYRELLVNDAMLAYKRTLMTIWHCGRYPLATLRDNDNGPTPGILQSFPQVPLYFSNKEKREYVSEQYRPIHGLIERRYSNYLEDELPKERFLHSYSETGDIQ